MTLSGFEHAWFFLFLLVVLGLIGLYIVVQLARQRRMLRFANMELLEAWRPNARRAGAPATILACCAAAVHGRDGGARDVQVRATVRRDASHRRVHVGPPTCLEGRLAAAGAKQFAEQLAERNLGLIATQHAACWCRRPRTTATARTRSAGVADRRDREEHLHRRYERRDRRRRDRWRDEAAPAHIGDVRRQTVPSNPDNPKGAYTAARTAKDQGVPISTVSFGTPYGYVEINDQRQPVPVDDEMLKKIAELSGGEAYTASSLEQLKEVFTNLQEQIGYETRKGDASAGWLRLGALVLALAALAALLINRRLPN
jgi:Ca-activated chloride channel family protein